MEYEENYAKFCKKFKSLCRENGYTVAKISEITEISLWDLIAIASETSSENVSMSAFFKLCNFFNISPEDMLR